MLLVLAASAALAAPQANAHPAARPAVVPEVGARPVARRAGIGKAHDEVSTSSREAQDFYDQGLAYLHSYVWLEAARSFNQALRLDPGLAIAHAQLSIAYTELNDPEAARTALARARALATQVVERAPAPGSSPARVEHDRQHVELRAMQTDAELSRPLDPAKLEAYRAALDRALTRFPGDEELWLLRGLAQSPDPAERGQGSTAESIPFYKKALALRPDHFAAHHYLTHAYENGGRIDEALVEAATYAKMAPSVPHARHMRGHGLRRVGRVDEAIAEFRAADDLETEYFKSEKVPIECDWHYQHNIDLLAASYQYVGQMAKAERLFKTSFAIQSPLVGQEFNKREWPMFLLSRGRAREALDAAMVLAGHRSPVVSGTGHVMAGEARLALGQYQAAADEGNTALKLMRNAEGAGLVAPALKQLQGEFLLRTGQPQKAQPMLEEVARDVTAARGPDAWTQALFTLESVARAAREAGAWELAGWAARLMIDHDPHYAGSHYALGLVAEHQGDTRQASAEFALALERWKNADPNLVELKRMRSRP